MKFINKFSILLLVVIILSCKKGIEKYDIKVDLTTTMLECFPNDSISLTFSIIPSGGELPYICTWVNPDTFSGFGPFTINIKDNLLINVNVWDANSIKTNFNYEIKKDTIDSLKYDYRNSFIGFYDCIVTCNSTNMDTWITNTRTYQDTLEVMKSDIFTKLSFSGAPVATSEVDLNYKNSTFRGYHTSGTLINDSIDMYTFYTPVGLVNYTYKGLKTK